MHRLANHKRLFAAFTSLLLVQVTSLDAAGEEIICSLGMKFIRIEPGDSETSSPEEIA